MNRRNAPPPRRASKGRNSQATASTSASPAAYAFGFVFAGAIAAGVAWTGCKHEPPPGAVPTPVAETVAPIPAPAPAPAPSHASTADASTQVAASAGSVDAGVDAAKPYDGPLIGATAQQAPVYSAMDWAKDKRIGYIRHGGKAPVDPTPIKASNCEAGWYHLVAGGYVCGKYATLDLNNPQVRLGTTPPNLDDILPYRYAWNTTMGTPLYRSVPSKEEMQKYEPYLKGNKKRRRTRDRDRDESATSDSAAQTDGSATTVAASDDPYGIADAGAGDASTQADKKPWWQNDFDGGKVDIKLADLTEGADDVVAKRMFKGFYVAIDKTFGWNGRLWYKTTFGLVAPADRMAIVKPPTFHGLELAGTDPKQPVGFILSTKAHKYEIETDGERHKVKVGASVDRFTIVRLTGTTQQVAGIVYRETTDGWWMKSIEGTYTDPGAPPEGLAPGEKWIDVNLSRQTLVAFEGDVPTYATLVSTGRHSKDKAHDHTTIRGSFRIREKHIATTMDGDGPAPGDMPYSIEDVPFVMYFEGSYALHGAFWHNNFGREQSHGCVNLAPLDAKRLFFWTDPPLPQGWHGIWAQKDTPGTRVVVHE